MDSIEHEIPEAVRADILTRLQARLADLLDLKMQAKQAHWNIKGTSFISLHELFDSLHSDVDGFADTVAERIVILGGQAMGTVQAVNEHTSLEAYSVEITAEADHLNSLIKSLEKLNSAIQHDGKSIPDVEDPVTCDILTEVSRGLDKAHWFLNSHI